MQIVPTRDHLYICVEKPAQETKTSSGLILKTQTVQNQTIGNVLACGEGRILQDGTLLPLPFKVGDKIIFYDFAGVKIYPENPSPNTDYFIIKANDVIAILN